MVFDSGGELPVPKRIGTKNFRFGSFNHARKTYAVNNRSILSSDGSQSRSRAGLEEHQLL